MEASAATEAHWIEPHQGSAEKLPGSLGTLPICPCSTERPRPALSIMDLKNVDDLNKLRSLTPGD